MMGYVKSVFLALLAVLAILVIVQNPEALNQPLELKLNLYLWSGSTAPYPAYLLIIIAFLLGIFLASLIGVCDRMRLRAMVKEASRQKEDLEREINSLRHLSLNLASSQGQAAQAAPKSHDAC